MKPFQPLRGDLVIFHHDGVLLVKRVIAVGGDAPRNVWTCDSAAGQHICAGDNRDYSLDRRDHRFGQNPSHKPLGGFLELNQEVRGKCYRVIHHPPVYSRSGVLGQWNAAMLRELFRSNAETVMYAAGFEDHSLGLNGL